MSKSIIGLFSHEDTFLEGAAKMKSAGIEDVSVMSPIPVHGIEKVLGERPNRIRYFSLAGALIGGACGFLLCVATALAFVLPTGGRAIIPLPPYLVISYEMTILFGVLATLVGFHVVSGLPAWRDAPYTEEVNIDKFAVVVPAGDDPQKMEQLMRDAGADEVRVWEPEA